MGTVQQEHLHLVGGHQPEAGQRWSQAISTGDLPIRPIRIKSLNIEVIRLDRETVNGTIGLERRIRPQVKIGVENGK